MVVAVLSFRSNRVIGFGNGMGVLLVVVDVCVVVACAAVACDFTGEIVEGNDSTKGQEEESFLFI
jgi:hypothetical protein